MKAVTIRVNDVEGVGGFVLPGDHVDVVLTRQADKNGATSDIVLQDVRVLGIDQVADERAEKPTVVKAVTLEVNLADGQKVALASAVGTLSLLLRKAGELKDGVRRQVTLTDLGNPNAPPRSSFVVVGVTRAAKHDEYNVPAEGAAQPAVLTH